MNFQKLFVCALLGMNLLAVNGCYDAPTPEPPKKIAFKKYAPFYLNVAYVNVTEEYKSSGTAPYVEQYFPTSPAQAMKNWVEERIRPIGKDRYLQVIIKDASVKEVQLPVTQGVKGLFTNDQSQRYDAKLEVEMRVYGSSSAMSEASLNIAATRSATIAENASADAREKLFQKITLDLMDEANAELERNILAYFGNYIDYNYAAPAPANLPGQ